MNEMDQNHHKQGEWKTYYGNGNVNFHGFFKDNKLTGECRFWSVQGLLREWVLMHEGKAVYDFKNNPDQYPTGATRTFWRLKFDLPLLPEEDNERED